MQYSVTFLFYKSDWSDIDDRGCWSSIFWLKVICLFLWHLKHLVSREVTSWSEKIPHSQSHYKCREMYYSTLTMSQSDDESLDTLSVTHYYDSFCRLYLFRISACWYLMTLPMATDGRPLFRMLMHKLLSAWLSWLSAASMLVTRCDPFHYLARIPAVAGIAAGISTIWSCWYVPPLFCSYSICSTWWWLVHCDERAADFRNVKTGQYSDYWPVILVLYPAW
jgi:hypothetical protein